jgi:hypothetical protein
LQASNCGETGAAMAANFCCWAGSAMKPAKN